MSIKQIIDTFSIRISVAVCMLIFVACDNDHFIASKTWAPVTAVELSVNEAEFTGTCPHTIKFTGIITTGAAGVVEYRFRDRADDFGYIKAGVLNFSSAGSRIVSPELVFTKSEAIEVELLARGTDYLTSNSLLITATCR